MKSILDPDFEYTPSVETDIRANALSARHIIRRISLERPGDVFVQPRCVPTD
jgi:hypothetical protein